MSVQVKTPTKTRFDCHAEIQCGDKSFTAPEGFARSKDDLHIKNEAKFSQPWGRKRRYSQSYRRDEGAARRKRIRSSYIGPLPNRFLNGGSIDDPLNLNGLDSSELGKMLNSVTPQSSPLPISLRRQSVEVRIPLNITDPLNLNDSDEEADLEKQLRKKKQRNRHKKKDDPLVFSPPKYINKDKNLMEALKIDIEPEKQLPEIFASKEFQKPRSICDKIVSPVVQISPNCKKNRRTNNGGRPEPSSSVSRSLPTSSISPSLNTPPKRFKHPKPQHAKTNTSRHKGEKVPAKFIYGNYNRYYGYRNPAMEEDKRLNCFKKEWFDGKCVLDIGCNVGNLTLSLARDYRPTKIVGIDIDSKLIAVARKNIRLFMSSSIADTGKFPISNVLNYGPIVAPPVSHKDPSKQSNFPHNVLFMQNNFVLESDELLDLQKEEYDVILALSVTKWVHFNWGDDGLKRFFSRVFRQLKPGGRFILEPQPWSSYKKKKKLTDEIFQNFQSIRLRPDQFTDYLLSKEIGFSTCNTVDVPFNASKGFRRPIIVFTKSDTVQNSPWSEVGSATPLMSSHSATFCSHLSHISEDSCSNSSLSGSQQPVSVGSIEEPASGDVQFSLEERSHSEDNLQSRSTFVSTHSPSEDLLANVHTNILHGTVDEMLEIQTGAKDSSVPDAVIHASSVPEMVTHASSVPEMVIQDSSVPETVIQDSSVPEMVIQDSSVPEMVIQDSSVTETVIQDRSVPETTIQDSSVPETVASDTYVSEKVTQSSSAPETVT